MNSRPNPYVGPRAFQPGEPFYGRDRELRSLSALLIAERIVLLHSPSGSGKTSLIQAGLLPRLREENFNVLPIIRVNTELPKSVVAIAGVNRYALSTMLSLEESLPEAERRPVSELATLTLDSYLSTRLRSEGTPVSDVLIFDQFEEVLTYAPTDRESKLVFFEQLGKALRNKDRWTLIAIREDYLGALAPYTRPIPGRLGATFRLDLLGVDGALQAIQKPAQANSVNFLASAAAKLADDLRRIQVQLPDGSLEEQLGPHVEPVQLQVVCYRLWQGLADDEAEINESDLAGVGDVNRALADYYAASAQAVAQKSGAGERDIREWFDRKLITPEGIRGQVLMGAEHSDGLPNRVVALLEDAHIIRGEKRAGKTWFELSHDRMIKPVRENNAAWFSANLSLFQQHAVLWAQQGRPDGMLLRGKPLVEAERESTRLQLTEDESAFLAACRKLRESEQREKRRTRISQGLTVVALIAMVVAVAFGVKASLAEASAKKAQNDAIAALNTADIASTKAVSALYTADIARTQEVAALNTADIAGTEAVNERDKAEASANINRSEESSSLAASYRDKNFLLALLLGQEALKIKDMPQSRGALFSDANTDPQLRQFLSKHTRSVNSIAFSPNGKMLASASDDNTIILWDLSTGKPIGQPLIGHTNGVNSIDFSPDGKTLASGSDDKTIIIWDVATGKPTGQPLIGHTDVIYSVAFSPDGKTLASGSVDKTIVLWDVATWKPKGQPLAKHKGAVNSIAFSPDGKTLASGSDDHTIILWNVATGKLQSGPLTGHGNPVESVAFSPDGRTLASGSETTFSSTYDTTIFLWDAATGKLIQPLIGSASSVYSVAFSPDGKTLASGSDDNTITLWNVALRQPIGDPLHGHAGSVYSVAFSPDGKTLASGSYDTTVILWDANNSYRLVGHKNGVFSLAYSSDGKTLASGSLDKTIILWDLTTGKPKGPPLVGHTEMIESVAFSPDGKTLASASDDKTIILWDVATGQRIGQRLLGHTSAVYSVAFSPDGKTLASGSNDKSIIIWDISLMRSSSLATGKRIGQPLVGHKDGVNSIAYSSDGKTLASGSLDKTIILWDVATGKPTGQPLVGHKNMVFSVAFSPDGKTLASGSWDKTIILWDLATGKPKDLPFTGHTRGIFSIVFSPDGKTLASASDDGSIILWNIATGQPIGQPLMGDIYNPVFSVVFSPDGKTLASGDWNHNILLWDLDPQSWEEKSCQRAGRNFTRAEWEKYFPDEPYDETCQQWPQEPVLQH